MALSGDAVALFLLQVTIVVGTASFLRTLATHYNQPGILAELAAGIILGPTILGKLSPEAFIFLFGGEASQYLEIVAWVGLILFMFVAGAEVSWQGAFKRKNLLVALGGLVAPLAAGILLASSMPKYLLPTRNVELFPISLAIVLSVTALPILAKMLQESGILKTKTGTTIMSAATVDDIVGWVLLALIVRSASGVFSIDQFLLDTALTILITVGLLFFGNIFVKTLISAEFVREHMFPAIMVLLFASATITEVVGLHPVLGAFMVGALLSRHTGIKEQMLAGYGPVSSNLLMPIFFILIGLKTDLTLIATAGLIDFTILMIVVGSLAKILGCFGGAIMGGFKKAEAMVIGAAMNAKGAVGLIVASVGLELGLFSPSLHASLITVVVVTTLFSPVMVRIFLSRLPQRKIDG